MENKWEYDYSGLYNQQNGGQGAAPQAGQPAQGTGYVNVGSSGTNAANTAGTGYQQPGTGANPQAQAYAQNAYNPYTQNPGYGGAQPPQQPPKKKGGAKKWLLRLVAGILVVCLGFGGGYAGALVAAGRTGAGDHVVYQGIASEGDSAAPALTNGSVSLTDVANLVSPSVVVITTEAMTTSNYWFGGSYVVSGAGSGVVMTEDGYIITNNHVVEGATSVNVTIEDSSYPATVVGRDSETDIAVIKIDATGLTPAVMGDSDSLAVGEAVVAVGNPLGQYGGSMTSGIISGLNREVTVENQTMSLIQTDASVSPGNSGGGLFDMKGQLVGIVNSKSTSNYSEGIGFAIPVNTALSVAQDLIESGYVTGRPVLGINVQVITAEAAAQYGLGQGGVYIAAVTEGSGAEAAGLQQGDLIVSVDDILVTSSNDVVNYISDKAVGDTVTMQVQRDGKLVSVDVVLSENKG